ncbi:Acyl-coenzyme A synthetase/AMP-(fatty) acid ligase [Microbulbifer donghaiensis]|uniref:Acyl-coenzyme A synthetase/AMP-(Fatty) acid ligase n=1 Tax=Microbulbifer donghaiensis TaxID=494016 RepID=A0A1M5B0C7_9GAMM|nr:AMP-binding protein [Microbulbifer donghaiensis]SHF35909.1 Acyl-coenzyme A synthetase/AMP-(fatty) acid ligase [Microbulbifer donghaiensis]
MLFDSVFGYRSDGDLVCHTRRGPVTFAGFKRHLADACEKLRPRLAPAQGARVALYSEDSYEFAVLMFAALASNAVVVIPANNKRGTAQQIGDVDLWLGQWNVCGTLSLEDLCRKSPDDDTTGMASRPPREFSGGIQLFTSGSSGEPQCVNKTLAQLLTELDAQQRHWGTLAAGATTLATVSHQHIYGLLFKVLWPLQSGRPFVAKTYVDVAALLRDAEQMAPALWIASPAQLSRRMDSWPWHLGRSLLGIFSSGGPLSAEDAQAIEQLSGVSPCEIYGSTETGGIAWRRQVDGPQWRPLAGVEVTADAEGLLRVQSPWLNGEFAGQDRIQTGADGSFRLLGRADRIVKIEEKRISLAQIETLLCRNNWVVEVRTLAVTRSRECVAAVVVLSAEGRSCLLREGRATLVRTLRAFLAPDLDGVAVPRLWRFVDAIPTNQQGKSPRELLMQLFDATPAAMLPRVVTRSTAEYAARVTLQVPAELPCLPGHFEGAPVVPGVVQIDWAMHYGRELLGLGGRFSSMEVIKFKQLMVPGETAVLELEFNPQKNKLKFCFRCDGDDQREFSSGQLCFDHG